MTMKTADAMQEEKASAIFTYSFNCIKLYKLFVRAMHDETAKNNEESNKTPTNKNNDIVAR